MVNKMCRTYSNMRIFFVVFLCILFGLAHSYSDEGDVPGQWSYDVNESLKSDPLHKNYDNRYDLPGFFKGFSGGCLAYYENTGFFYEHGNIYARTYLRGPNAHYPDCKKLDFQYFQDND